MGVGLRLVLRAQPRSQFLGDIKHLDACSVRIIDSDFPGLKFTATWLPSDGTSASHYEITPMQYTAIFHSSKNDNFHLISFAFFPFLLK